MSNGSAKPYDERSSLLTGLGRVREAARRDSQIQFTALLHHLTEHLLIQAFKALNRQAKPGVDQETWQTYACNYVERIRALRKRVHKGTYRAQPSLRIYLPKPGGGERPIGIAALEDKIVQQAMVWVLEAIYEEDFLGFSYGSRPGRNPHQALDAVSVAITQRKVNWVLDADLRSFFDTIDHECLMKMLAIRVGDRRVLRLIRKWLRAGVSEDGEWSRTSVGTPQGAVTSPLLANVYLHYALDLWVCQWRRRHAKGEVYLVRYVDDFVMGFQYKQDAEAFQQALRERLAEYHLSLNEQKTRLIEFGRFAADNRKDRGERRPETFDFLGFTHQCSRAWQTGRFQLKRATSRSRKRRFLAKLKVDLRKRMHDPVADVGAWLRRKLLGRYQYFCVPGNRDAEWGVRQAVIRLWHQTLRRRSQKGKNLTWKKVASLFDRWLPCPRTMHPYPSQRLCV